MEKEHILDINMVIECFHKYIKNQIIYNQKNNFYSIFQVITQQFQQVQKDLN